MAYHFLHRKHWFVPKKPAGDFDTSIYSILRGCAFVHVHLVRFQTLYWTSYEMYMRSGLNHRNIKISLNIDRSTGWAPVQSESRDFCASPVGESDFLRSKKREEIYIYILNLTRLDGSQTVYSQEGVRARAVLPGRIRIPQGLPPPFSKQDS